MKKPSLPLRCRLTLCKWAPEDLPCECPYGLSEMDHNCLKKARRRCLLCGRTEILTLSTMGDPVGEYYWEKEDPPAPIPTARTRR